VLTNITQFTSKDPLRLILFRPRTGSSLLAQTLRHLGAPVLGEFRTDCDEELNPRGFWDIPEIRNNGLTREKRAEYSGRLPGAVVKILLGATLNDDAEQWRWFDEVAPRIFITYRHPLEETLSSTTAFTRKKAGTQDHFIEVTQRLRGWARPLGRLIETIRLQHPTLIDRSCFVGYHEHLDDPVGFVAKLARHARLSPTPPQIEAAIANIDTSLYRFRLDELPVEYRRWYEPMPARNLFDALRNDPDSAWNLDWPKAPSSANAISADRAQADGLVTTT